jgi:endonuclease III related protein
MRVRRRLLALYDRLFAAYGPQHWWPGDGAFETVVGAILTQSAAWPNVEQAIARLRAAGALSPEAIIRLPEAELADLIRPSGYFNAKTRKLRAFCLLLDQEFHGSLDQLLQLPMDDLRDRLLSTHGIGPETADDIILYAAQKPTFVIDSYTRRIFSRIGIVPERDDYESWRALFMSTLPSKVDLFNEYHALIVRHAKLSCAKQPRCEGCVIRDLCTFGSSGCRESLS